jgi:hypothetical protein
MNTRFPIWRFAAGDAGARRGVAMIIDLQMTADHFPRGIRSELRSQAFCFTGEVPLGGETVLLDHVEVSDTTSVKRIPRRSAVQEHDLGPLHPIDGSAVQVTQEVLLHFTRLSALQGSGAAPTPPSPDAFLNPRVVVHFVLTLVLVDPSSRCVPCVRHHAVRRLGQRVSRLAACCRAGTRRPRAGPPDYDLAGS